MVFLESHAPPNQPSQRLWNIYATTTTTSWGVGTCGHFMKRIWETSKCKDNRTTGGSASFNRESGRKTETDRERGRGRGSAWAWTHDSEFWRLWKLKNSLRRGWLGANYAAPYPCRSCPCCCFCCCCCCCCWGKQRIKSALIVFYLSVAERIGEALPLHGQRLPAVAAPIRQANLSTAFAA